MSNEDLVENIKYYQESGNMHPLTCECTTNFRPKIENDKVVLVCPHCSELQTHIPNIPTIEQIKSMEDTMKNMYNQSLENNKPPEPDTTQTRTITYDVTFRVTETLDFDPADWGGDIQTMDEYQDYQMDSKREYTDELFDIIGDTVYTISEPQIKGK